MFDSLHTVDWVVEDPVGVATRFSEVFGLPAIRPDFVQALPSHGYEAVFARTTSRLGDAPTRFEFIAPRPVAPQRGCSVAPLEDVAGVQARRPQRTHATVVCVDDFDGFVDLVHRRGAPVWVESGCEHLPHRRAWVGWTDSRLYIPGFDGGVWLEAIATSALGPRLVKSVTDPAPPTVARISRRVHLVGDLDAALRTLERFTGFTPSEATRWDGWLGGRVARFAFRHPASACLDLVQPRGPGFAADYFARWGEGPLLTTIAVPDLAAAAAGAAAIGAVLVEGLAGDRGPVLEHGGLGGILVELAPSREESG